MTDALESCPFCGGKAVEVIEKQYKHTFSKERAERNAGDLSLIEKRICREKTHYKYVQYFYGVWCEKTDCPGHTRIRYHNRTDAISAWNQRVEQA